MHRIYTDQGMRARITMGLYDAVVYRFNCPVLWRCPKSRLVEMYNSFVSGRHLDIGVATGRLLRECRFPVAKPQITLMDLNPVALEVASARLERYAPRAHRADVLKEWGLDPRSYDSVGMCNIIHCLPGSIPDKAVVFEHARNVLAPGGVLFGSTILGKGVDHTWRSRAALWDINRRGIMSTRNDSLEDLEAAIGGVFESHEIRVQGAVALFSAYSSTKSTSPSLTD